MSNPASMVRVFFILGRNPALSIAEIESLFKRIGVGEEPKIYSRELLIAEIPDTIDIVSLYQKLGGTIKIGIIVKTISLDESEDALNDVAEADFLKNQVINSSGGKLRFGISIYNLDAPPQYVAQLYRKTGELCKSIKTELKSAGIKSGFVLANERFLSSVTVVHNGMLTDGFELVLCTSGREILVGKTLAVQEFGRFTFRDMGRPERDKKSGIIPPKLARIMLNLAGASEHSVILDPFCGSGTILMEAVILGCRHIMGVDISEKAVMDTKTNLQWLFDHTKDLNRLNFSIHIDQKDARVLLTYFSRDIITEIVTEPYLGPTLHRSADDIFVERTFQELIPLYRDAISSFAHVLKPGGMVAMVYPAFNVRGNMRFLDLITPLKSLGFNQIPLFLSGDNRKLFPEITDRGTIIYGNREDFVLREIVRFQKKV